MANLRETSTWETGIYQIEENDPVHGGENGITNRPAKQLANRTKYLQDNKVQKTTIISAGNGLTGGGDLSANRSLALGTPSQITATSTNSVTAESHSHAIDKASTTGAGIVQLNDTLASTSTTQALTAHQGKLLEDKKLDKTTVFTVEGNNKVYRYHDVAMFAKRTEPVTGVIAIKLPTFFRTMYAMLLQGFNYDHSSSWSAEISAYQYTATSVIKPSINIHGKAPFNKVQIGSKDGSHFILLGETNTIWNYPLIHIKEVLAHYFNQQYWETGYEFSIETDLSAFQILAEPTLYGTPRVLSAEKLVTPRQLSISGDATATANFDGTANANLALTLANTGVTAGTYQSVTVDAKGRVSSGLAIVNGLVTATTAAGVTNQATNNNNTYLNLVTRTGTASSSAGSSTKITGQNGVSVSSDTSGNLLISNDLINHISRSDEDKPASAWLTNYLYVNKLGRTENAFSASKLQTARTINGVAFDGTQNITIEDPTKVEKATKGAGTDVRGLKQDGIYALGNGGVNLPTGGAYKVLALAGNNPAWVHQIAIGAYSTDIWLSSQRAAGSEDWLNWKRLDGADWDDVRNKPTNLAYTNGNIASATKLQTARTINGVAFDGTQNITIEDATKVSKTGGTMTGSLNLSSDNTMINVGSNNDFAVIKKAGLGGAIAFGANNRFRVYKSNNAQVNPNDTLTQVFEVDANGNATAANFIGNLQGHATTSGMVRAIDNRYVRNSQIPVRSLSLYFMTKDGMRSTAGGNWGDFLVLNSYADESGGKTNALFFNKNTQEIIHTQAPINSGSAWEIGRTLAYIDSNVASATKLQTARTINGVAFDGSQNITIGADWNDVRNKAAASLTQAGITQLNSSVTANTETQSATPKAVKTAYDKAIAIEQDLNRFKNHSHTVAQITDFIAQVQAQIRAGLQIQRKDYTGTLTPSNNHFRTQSVQVSGSVEVLPDGRIIQRFNFTCPVHYFHRHSLSAFYREKLGLSRFGGEDQPLLELPLWTAMPNKVQEARIHLSSSDSFYASGEALEWSYDWDSIFNQHANIKDKAYFAFRRVYGGENEMVTFNIVVEGY